MPAAPQAVRATHVAGLSGTAGVSLAPPRFVGAATSVLEVDAAATEQRNDLRQQTLGTRIDRASGHVRAQPVGASSVDESPDNAVHTVLYPFGKGGFYAKEDKSNLTREHHRKKTLLSVAEPNHNAEELLWHEHQGQVKRSLHGESVRLAGADTVNAATPSVARAHTTMWEQANRGLRKHITSAEAFTTGVPKKMVGGKAYWCPASSTYRQRVTQRG